MCRLMLMILRSVNMEFVQVDYVQQLSVCRFSSWLSPGCWIKEDAAVTNHVGAQLLCV